MGKIPVEWKLRGRSLVWARNQDFAGSRTRALKTRALKTRVLKTRALKDTSPKGHES